MGLELRVINGENVGHPFRGSLQEKCGLRAGPGPSHICGPVLEKKENLLQIDVSRTGSCV
jgi:hypothetical protein